MTTKKGSIEIHEKDDSLEILKGAPPGAPGWILGLAFLVCVFLSNFVSTWLAISPDVKQYLANKKEIDVAEIGARQVANREERETLLSLAAKHSEQYTMLARSLETMSGRAAETEREVGRLRAKLEACEASKVATEMVTDEVKRQIDDKTDADKKAAEQ